MAENNSTTDKFDTLPSPQDFCLSVPLYEQFRFDQFAESPFADLHQYWSALDCFCHGCRKQTVFKRLDVPLTNVFGGTNNYVFSLWFACSRNDDHKSCFVFRSHEGILQKIGQYPSIADLVTPDLQKYRPVLGDDSFRELTRAIGLVSHGVGVGAFVYLRRIFESLIKKAKNVAAKESGWDESQSFANVRMDEKIVMLKQYLPVFLYENRSLYSIMSVGVHTLSEAKCLKAFPVIRVGIEFILDEQLEMDARKKKIADAAKGISALEGELKGTGK